MPDKILNLCEGEGNIKTIFVQNEKTDELFVNYSITTKFPNPIIVITFNDGQINTYSGFPFLLVETPKSI